MYKIRTRPGTTLTFDFFCRSLNLADAIACSLKRSRVVVSGLRNEKQQNGKKFRQSRLPKFLERLVKLHFNLFCTHFYILKEICIAPFASQIAITKPDENVWDSSPCTFALDRVEYFNHIVNVAQIRRFTRFFTSKLVLNGHLNASVIY